MDAKQNDRSSVTSRRSLRLTALSASSLIRARTKSLAAKARIVFAEQEAKAKIESATREAEHQKIKADRDVAYQLEKARTDAELETLAIHSQAAAAEAEAAVWEAADAMENCLLLDETGPSE